MKKFICPDCGKKEVEEMNGCGVTSYFCNNCKKMISRSRIKVEENSSKDQDKA